jgi:Na+-transporting methylmalonyl-CoA/oxaloacetate decarboxylase gamma subunit
MEIDMSDVLIQSLQITALGMGLVFGAILVLWLMMVLLTTITAEKESALENAHGLASESIETAAVNLVTADESGAVQAAAVAVAMALADQEMSSAHPLPEPPTAIVSAWQLGMRSRLLAEKGHTRRH